jgi:hypothetical protein
MYRSDDRSILLMDPPGDKTKPAKKDRIAELLASIRVQQPEPHTHRVQVDLARFPAEDFFDYVIVLEDGCPVCDRLRSTDAIYKTRAYQDYWNAQRQRN